MTNEEREDLETKLAQLNARLTERVASIPAHSIRPHQFIEIEELEEEIAEIEKRLESTHQTDADTDHAT